tara:strand:+ start:73 stop:402 length:330 start_codon:yes stop_codon:yes gene_type:complete
MRKPKITYVDRLPFNYNGVSTPFGIYITKENKGSKALLDHELIHYKQQQKGGVFFYLDYIFELITKGYDKNKYEVQARHSEKQFCKTNYTYCVRNGLAETSHNKNFRKW